MTSPPIAAYRPRANKRYRNIAEHAIIEMILIFGWAQEIHAGQREMAAAATRRALETWIRGGLGYRSGGDGQKLFDPAEVFNFTVWAGLTGQDDFWLDRIVKTARSHIHEFSAALPEGGFPAKLEPARFCLSLRREFDLRRLPAGMPVRLRLPQLLAGAELEPLETIPVTPPGLDPDVALRPDHVEFRLAVPAEGLVTLAAEYSFIATPMAGRGGTLDEEARARYLRPSEGLIRVSPRIAALAVRLAGTQSSARRMVAAFWNYMLDHFLAGYLHYGDIPPQAPCDWMLDHGWGDCQLNAALLISLCRARFIPARLVSGHTLYRLAPAYHYWAEIWLEDTGWTPFDMFSWELSGGGRDAAWRGVFAGQVDYRAVMQKFPLRFTGPMSVTFPPAWQMLTAAAGEGVCRTYLNAEDSTLIYRDTTVAGRQFTGH